MTERRRYDGDLITGRWQESCGEIKGEKKIGALAFENVRRTGGRGITRCVIGVAIFAIGPVEERNDAVSTVIAQVQFAACSINNLGEVGVCGAGGAAVLWLGDI